ncbi:MAG: hypothetical protein Q7R63_00955 [bacterium]|nr:hypothetical protein [bacterium]
MVKRLSIIVIILAAVVLLYGFIDASSYRSGYAAGSVTVSRLVERACAGDLVVDTGLCDAAEAVLYPPSPDESMGLAQISATVTQVRRSRRSRRSSRAAAASTVQPAAEVAALPTESAFVITPATQKVLDRITAVQALPADFCSKNTPNDCIPNGNFMCGKPAGVCAFTPLVAGFRSIPAGQTASYMACLTPEIIDRIGVGKRVGNWCVAVDGSSRMVALSNPSEVRMTSEQARDSSFRQALTESGISASTAVTPIAATAPTLLTCEAANRGNMTGPWIMPPNCTMDYGMMNMSMPSCPSNRWSNGVCVSSAYIPSTLAQLIDAFIGLFR